jgi:hypothetical protein
MASVFTSNSSVNSQPETTKVRDNKLGSGDQFSASEKDESCIVHIIGLEEHNLGSLVNMIGPTQPPSRFSWTTQDLAGLIDRAK